MNYVKIAKAYAKAGYSVIPVNSNKIPSIKQWKEYQNKSMDEKECELYFDNVYGMALLCGGEHNLTAIDIDLKNDLSGDFYDRFVNRIPPAILEKLYIQKTKNGGYHMVFSCKEKCEGNQKLASRFVTPNERHKVYIENFENPITRDKAFKIAGNYNILCIIETRGAGGYILIAPSPGYEKVQGRIGELDAEEYDILLCITREMDEVNKTHKKDSRFTTDKTEWKVSPFKDFNERYDIPYLLERNGWSTVGKAYGRNLRFKRPGQTHAKSSAILDMDTKIFSVFTTSTDLDNSKGYTATDLFVQFECGGDIGQCYSKLVEMGYGRKN